MSPGARAAAAVVLIAAAGPAGFFAYRALLADHLVQPSEGQLTAELARSSGSAPGTTGLSPGASVAIGTAGASGASGAGSMSGAPPQGAAPTSGAQSAAPQPHIPAQLPQITLPDPSGAPRKLSDWRGRPLLINFWATWCEPCRREIPLLEKLRNSEPASRLEIVGIAVDERAAVLRYARAMHIDYPILIGGDTGGFAAISAFGMADALPFTVFADSRGRILTVKVGELHSDGARLIVARLEDVDRGRLSLAAARKQISAGLEALAVKRAQQAAGGRPLAKS
ncbi:MAG: TlpA family protein disulfide reductase [Steroidobacteraceae bacterium]